MCLRKVSIQKEIHGGQKKTVLAASTSIEKCVCVCVYDTVENVNVGVCVRARVRTCACVSVAMWLRICPRKEDAHNTDFYIQAPTKVTNSQSVNC